MPAPFTIPRIETARLVLREWRDEDLEAYAAMNADPDVRTYMFPGRPLSREESEGEVARMMDQWHRLGFGHWAVELRETGELIGRTGAKRHDDWDLDPENTEVGWLYAREAWGSGYATEGATAAVRFLLEDLRRPEVISIAHLSNLASHRVMRKSGLEWAGARRWYERRLDVVWYSSRSRTAEKTGDPPRGFRNQG